MRATIAPPKPERRPVTPQPITMSDEIVVESNALMRPAVNEAVHELTSNEIEVLPHIGEDPLRALDLLPGLTTQDTSAEVQLRGSRRDELLIRLDGQELFQ